MAPINESWWGLRMIFERAGKTGRYENGLPTNNEIRIYCN